MGGPESAKSERNMGSIGEEVGEARLWTCCDPSLLEPSSDSYWPVHRCWYIVCHHSVVHYSRRQGMEDTFYYCFTESVAKNNKKFRVLLVKTIKITSVPVKTIKITSVLVKQYQSIIH